MQFLRLALSRATTAFKQSCGTVVRLDAVPADLVDRATTPGIPDSRYWLGAHIGPFIEGALNDHRREVAFLAAQGLPTDPLPPIHVLAISGGGDRGAFGAGLLSGWTAHGSRPRFKVVTGISAGALIAPFAYLGPAHDPTLREFAVSAGLDGVFRTRALLAGLSSDGMADSAPLARLVEKYVTPGLLSAIAAEYATGRALVVGTTELDSGRAVSWNMGAIAGSGTPEALELFRRVMVASASIPGVVTPVMIDVEVEGRRYQEMHVDGGVINQVFTYPSNTLAALERALGRPYRREMHIYAVRNGKLLPEWAATPRRTLSIGGRAFGLLMQRQGLGDLEQIYRTALQDGADFNLACIGADFTQGKARDFDPEYMQHLFDYAHRRGAQGCDWQKTLPGGLPPR